MEKENKDKEYMFIGSLHEYSPKNKKFNLFKLLIWIAIFVLIIALCFIWYYAVKRFSHG